MRDILNPSCHLYEKPGNLVDKGCETPLVNQISGILIHSGNLGYLLTMPEREVVSPEKDDCGGELHPFAIKGLLLFNQGEYWKAHEALEEAWREEAGQVRHLYRGILQVGVAYLHIKRGNYDGAMKLYRRSKYWLDPFPRTCRGVDVGQLQRDLETAIAEVRRLGPGNLSQINTALLRPVIFQAVA